MTDRAGKTRRHGFSLIDTVAMMLVAAMLVGLAARMLHHGYQTQLTTMRQLRQLQQLQQLHARLRQDCRQATPAVEDGRLHLRSGQRRLMFKVDSTVHREDYRDDQLVGRETWQLPAGTRCEWSVESSPGRTPLVVCLLTDDTADPIRWTFRAALSNLESESLP